MEPGQHCRARRRRDIVPIAVAAALLAYGPSLALAYDWPQFDGNAQHSGSNTQEAAITVGNAGTLHRLFQVALPAVADGAPAYLGGASTPGGPRDLLFVTTKAGHIIALDAHSGAQVWSHQYAAGSCTINNGSQPCYTTSSPAIDPNRQYVYAYGLDGYVHKYQVGDGTEIRSGGWPELATRKGFDEKGSSALGVATARNGTSYLYVTNGGYPGDRGDYQGHVTAINLATGAQHVFNMLCSNQVDVHFYEAPATPDCPQVQSAVWARAGVVYDPDTDRLYAATGNGTYNPSAFDWGDSVVALNPDGTGNSGTPLDSYTPANYQQLQNGDLDLGSTAPVILPVPAASTMKHLALQSGKDGLLRLLNLDNLSGRGGPGHTGGEVASISVPQGNEVLTAPAVWVNPADGKTWAFVANDNGIAGLQLTVNGAGTPGLSTIWQRADGGSSPIVANGVLFYAGNNTIHAINAVNNAQLWHDASIGGIHWESPVVANGTLYITDESANLTAYVPALWSLQSSGTSNTLTAVTCPASTSCVAVGDGDTVLTTANGGATWSLHHSGTGTWHKGTACPSANTCFAVGDGGTIVASANGGVTWQRQNSGVATTLYSIACPGTSICYAVGAGGVILRTGNGGATWAQQSSGTTATLYGVACPTASDCWAAGTSGTTVATTNGGAVWTSQATGTTHYFYGIACPSTSACFAVASHGGIRATTNGGASWTGQSSGTAYFLRGIACTSVTTCIAVGDAGTIVATTNGGAIWSAQPSGTTANLAGIACTGVTTCTAVGTSGAILRHK